MKKHTKIYMDYFSYQIPEDVYCEVCGKRAVDIHHIEARGMGGSKEKDVIENLMALCRSCHEFYEGKKQYKVFLKITHKQKMNSFK